MRQVQGLLKVIGKAELVEFYETMLSYAVVQGVELPSLDAFLAVSSDKEVKEPKAFDEDTDKFLEMQALKRLNERQQLR